MKNKLLTITRLSSASTKMYFRNFSAVFFSLLFPVIFLVVFGFINTSSDLKLQIKLFNNSDSEIAQQFEESITSLEVFDVVEEDITLQEAKDRVANGEINYAVVVPENFGENFTKKQQVDIYFNQADQNFADTGASIISSILDRYNTEANKKILGQAPLEVFTVSSQPVQSDDLDAIDYLVPGIIAFSIMSLGIFSISQGFITYKASGALRRLFVTPVGPFSFIVGQSVARLLMTVANVVIMLVLGVLLFDFSMQGGAISWINFIIFSLIGVVMFLGMGFAIAGWAENEDQAAPLSNIIFFPMMFLSGTFFPRELFPEWLQPITDILPLTYLADGLRLIANEGATLLSLGYEIGGLVIWTVLSYTIAVKVFRWE